MFEMFFQILLLLTCIFGIFVILGLLFSKKNRGKIFKKAMYLCLPLCGLLLFFWSFIILESSFYRFFDSFIVFIFELEFLGILICIVALYFTLKKHPRPPYLINIFAIIIIFLSHIMFAGLMADLFRGTVITLIISVIIFLSNDFFRGKFKSVIHTIQMNLRTPFFLRSIRFENKLAVINSEYLPCDYEMDNASDINERNNEVLKTKKKSKVKFWHAVVEITQPPIDDQLNNNNWEKTWLKNFFNKKSSYALRLKIHNRLQWEIFMNARNKFEAIRAAKAILTELKHIYQGLDGIIKAVPITSDDLYQKRIFYEIFLPKPPFMNKILFIEKAIKIFDQTQNEIEIYILWKEAHPYKREKIRLKINNMIYEDDYTKEKIFDMWTAVPFKIRIFIASKVHSEDPTEIEEQKAELQGILRTLIMDIKNVKKRAHFKRTSSGTYIDILKINHYKGRVITHKVIDFDFPENFPLLKAPILAIENIKDKSVSINDKNYIALGLQYHRGVLTKNIGYVHIDAFASSCFIGGLSGSGKTYLILWIIKELASKRSEVGILNINIGKENQQHFYKKHFKVIKYGDPEFKVPYYVKGSNPEQTRQETSSIIAASLGLNNVVINILLNVMQQYDEQLGDQPESLMVLFNTLTIFMEKNPYHEKLQTNLLRAIKNRIMPLLASKTFHDTVIYTQKIPKWFVDWQNGENIFLDLSTCNEFQKRLLIMLILQMVRTLTPKREAGKLTNLIIIDESKNIVRKPTNNNPYDYDFISKEQLEKIYIKLVSEFRALGVGFLFADQYPSVLFPCVVKVSLQIIFRVKYPCNTIFTENYSDRDLLPNLKNRVALVMNGVESENFLIQTLDYDPPKQPQKVLEMNIEDIKDGDFIRNPEYALPNKLQDATVSNIDCHHKLKIMNKQNEMKLILKEIIKNPNYLNIEEKIVDHELFKFLTEKYKEYIKIDKIKEPYCILYAIFFDKLKNLVGQIKQLDIEESSDLFQFVFNLYFSLYRNGLEVDNNIYDQFQTIGFLHSGFMRQLSGIEKELSSAKKAFRDLYYEICEKLKKFTMMNKSVESVLSD